VRDIEEAMYLRIGKFLLVIATSAMVVVLAACASSEEKEQASGEASPGLREVVPEQVGDYTFEDGFTESEILGPEAGAVETFVSFYQAPDGEQVLVGLWSFPSAYEVDQAKQTVISQEQDAGLRPAETFSVYDVQGTQLGTGLVLQDPESETVVWTDNSILALTGAPQGRYGMDFYQALYSDREGTSLTSGAAQSVLIRL
jgi:hypothetical protein